MDSRVWPDNEIHWHVWGKFSAFRYDTSALFTIAPQVRRLYTIDPVALGHILQNSQVYQKPDIIRSQLSLSLGNGMKI